MAKRAMTEEQEIIEFLKEHGFTPATKADEEMPLLKGSFDWPSCFKTPKKKTARKIAVKKSSGIKDTRKRAAV